MHVINYILLIICVHGIKLNSIPNVWVSSCIKEKSTSPFILLHIFWELPRSNPLIVDNTFLRYENKIPFWWNQFMYIQYKLTFIAFKYESWIKQAKIDRQCDRSWYNHVGQCCKNSLKNICALCIIGSQRWAVYVIVNYNYIIYNWNQITFLRM